MQLTENFSLNHGKIEHLDLGFLQVFDNDTNIVGAIETYYTILFLTDKNNFYETTPGDIENEIMPVFVGKFKSIYYENFSMACVVIEKEEKNITICYSNNSKLKKCIIDGEIDYAYVTDKNDFWFCCIGNNLIIDDLHYICPGLKDISNHEKYDYILNFFEIENLSFLGGQQNDEYIIRNSNLFIEKQYLDDMNNVQFFI